LAATYFSGGAIESITSADFDGDTFLDLAAPNWTLPATISVLMGSGTGLFSQPISVPVNTIVGHLSHGDFNGDMMEDLIACHTLSKTVSFLLGIGTGSFVQSGTSYTVGDWPKFSSIADVDNDGKSDLAVCNYYSQDISILLGMNTGSFQPAISFSAGLRPVSLCSGDFNGDAKTDLAVVDYTLNCTEVFLSCVANPTTSIFESDKDNEIKIFPNPSQNNIFIKSHSEISAIKIYNAYGILVKTKFKHTEEELDISDLPDGCYLIKIEKEGDKLLKETLHIKMSRD
jgi:hypothetical protein